MDFDEIMAEAAGRFTDMIDSETENMVRVARTTAITTGLLGVTVGIAISAIAVAVLIDD